VLTLGRSQVVHSVLRRAAETKNFNVIVTEGRPDGSGTLLLFHGCMIWV
jgi:translation initiation factor 2B subunit (eIF-2B alpha/beta/delta family)